MSIRAAASLLVLRDGPQGMQLLLMRRPETDGFISVSPPSNMYDFSFLAPCPASGLFLHGTADTVVPPVEVERVEHLDGLGHDFGADTVTGENCDFHVVCCVCEPVAQTAQSDLPSGRHFMPAWCWTAKASWSGVRLRRRRSCPCGAASDRYRPGR